MSDPQRQAFDPAPPRAALPAELAAHPAYSRVFQPGRLTFGLIAPLDAYRDSIVPDLRDHAALVDRAESHDFAAIWLRDVPFVDPAFGDAGQVFDPLVYAGWLAARTRRIAIGTAGIVLTLRDPVMVAKQAATLDQLLDGRLLLGLSTGDRPAEYPAMAADFDNRADRYRDAHEIVRVLTESRFPIHASRHYGQLNGRLELLPKPFGARMPTLAIGRCGQSLEWLARHTDGWIWHQGDFTQLPHIVAHWRDAQDDPSIFKPYGYGAFFDLDEDPDAPLQTGRGVRGGRHALIDMWKQQQALGVSHVALNFKTLRRPAVDVMDELAEYVLPHFRNA
ncbi:TIGR03571 family LLM class oxidoreductase [Burkholderia sp. JSH-S8]|uniref:TIGR03571 family LLM class oxidoreductase n=1 Tax=Burkholderia stagnalis TaxID=1503054 RepID=UPI0002FDB938|nr:TIGR03571 family LLM class oxidoreductase [Burkholderia stagnalis]WGS44298.1 TIGR03571 family LLM class oxidoreductase [Burkholderia sp. JSH-S8]